LNKKEVVWLLGTVVFILILGFAFFDLGNSNDSVLDINVHDTYFIILKRDIFILFSIFSLFIVYLIRLLKEKFKNLVVNTIFIITNVIVIIILTQIISIVDSFAKISGTTEYPPLSGGTVEHTGNSAETFSFILLITQILFLILLIYTSIKTGKNYNPKM
jgi:hypothetical protein